MKLTKYIFLQDSIDISLRIISSVLDRFKGRIKPKTGCFVLICKAARAAKDFTDTLAMLAITVKKYIAKINPLGASLVVCLVLSGCGTAGVVATVANTALELSGLKKPQAPELPELQKPPRQISVSLSTSKNLNADPKGQPLAAVLRIYKLKDPTIFYQTSFDNFVTPGKDKEALGDSLVETREIMLVPDKDLTWKESVPRQAMALGFVVLFHAPAAQRWRFAFDPAESEKSGVRIGAHACALTVTRGVILPWQDAQGQILPNTAATNLLAPVECKKG